MRGFSRRRWLGGAHGVDQVAAAWCHDGGRTAAFRVVREGSPTTAWLSDRGNGLSRILTNPPQPPWQCGRRLAYQFLSSTPVDQAVPPRQGGLSRLWLQLQLQ